MGAGHGQQREGGVFNVSKGLQKEFGKKRVFNAPIAEDFIVGTANGMSRYSEKIRIVIEGAEFADYFWPAMEQYVDSSHDYWRSNGKFTPNVTIRLASGGTLAGDFTIRRTSRGRWHRFRGCVLSTPHLPMMQRDCFVRPCGRGA